MYAHVASRSRNGRQLFIRSCHAFRGICSKASVSNSHLTAKASWGSAFFNRAYDTISSWREPPSFWGRAMWLVEGEKSCEAVSAALSRVRIK